MIKSKVFEKFKGNFVLATTKGAFWGVAFSLVCVLIFAFVIKFTSISESAISPVNQVIKVLSVLFGCYIACKKLTSHGWLAGLVVGFCYTILSFLIFSILDGHFNFGLNILNDITFGTICGVVAGILCFALKKK